MSPLTCTGGQTRVLSPPSCSLASCAQCSEPGYFIQSVAPAECSLHDCPSPPAHLQGSARRHCLPRSVLTPLCQPHTPPPPALASVSLTALILVSLALCLYLTCPLLGPRLYTPWRHERVSQSPPSPHGIRQSALHLWHTRSMLLAQTILSIHRTQNGRICPGITRLMPLHITVHDFQNALMFDRHSL